MIEGQWRYKCIPEDLRINLGRWKALTLQSKTNHQLQMKVWFLHPLNPIAILPILLQFLLSLILILIFQYQSIRVLGVAPNILCQILCLYHRIVGTYKAFTSHINSESIPRNVEEAHADSKWKKAIDEEMNALKKNETWDNCLFTQRKTANGMPMGFFNQIQG